MFRVVLLSLFLSAFSADAYSQVTVSLPAAVTTVGETVSLELFLEGGLNAPVLAFQFTLTYDPSVVLNVSVTKDGTLSEGFLVTSNNRTPGILKVAAASGSGLSASGVLLKLNFIGVSSGWTGLDLGGTMILNAGTPTVVEQPGSITVPSGVDVEIGPEPDSTGGGLSVYPNPVRDRACVKGITEEDAAFTADMTGRLVKLSMTQTGNEEACFEAKGRAAGHYLLLAVRPFRTRSTVFAVR